MSCSINYCINGTGTYDGDYLSAGTHNGYDYFTGDTYTIFYSTGSTCWCLSSVLDGSCLLFGKSPCLSECPDLCDEFFSEGSCPPPTPVPSGCTTIDFDVIFDCEVTPTPSPTPTSTPTPTPTPSPSPYDPCSGVSLSVSAITYTPTPTPTPTTTPTPSPEVTRPCNYTGLVIFNTLDDYIRCSDSKKFKDCYNGFSYISNDVILAPGGGQPLVGFVYGATINGNEVCVTYLGLVTNTSGVDNITLNTTYGLESEGNCQTCLLPSPTPTPTSSSTPTPTPTPTSSSTPTPTPTPTSSPIPCPDCVEHDVVIGTQTWAGCNAIVEYYNNGDPIPEVTDPSIWTGLTTGAWCYYNNDSSNEATYGKLYNWYAINDPRGIAPTGYHVPSDYELLVLSTFLGGSIVAGGKLKESGTCHWDSPNTGTNTSLFTALPSGTREFSNGIFTQIGTTNTLWSSDQYDMGNAWVYRMSNNVNNLDRLIASKKYGFSLRFIKD